MFKEKCEKRGKDGRYFVHYEKDSIHNMFDNMEVGKLMYDSNMTLVKQVVCKFNMPYDMVDMAMQSADSREDVIRVLGTELLNKLEQHVR